MLMKLLNLCSLSSLTLLICSSLAATDSTRVDLGSENEIPMPYNIGIDDTSQGPDELYKLNNPYDPNPDSYNTNQGYDEYNPAYNEPINN